jgi:hypothetical protein
MKLVKLFYFIRSGLSRAFKIFIADEKLSFIFKLFIDKENAEINLSGNGIIINKKMK